MFNNIHSTIRSPDRHARVDHQTKVFESAHYPLSQSVLSEREEIGALLACIFALVGPNKFTMRLRLVFPCRQLFVSSFIDFQMEPNMSEI